MARDRIELGDGVYFDLLGEVDDLAEFEIESKGWLRGELAFPDDPATRIEVILVAPVRLQQDVDAEMEVRDSMYLENTIVVRSFSFPDMEAALRRWLPQLLANAGRRAGVTRAPLTLEEWTGQRPQRVLVAGVSGAGKTTVAGRVAAILGIGHTEIEALYHGENWERREEFDDDVRALADSPAWVTEWTYPEARPVLAARADLLVWLDLPFATVTLPRLVRRTIQRWSTREELWNGNVEPPLSTILTDPDHVVRNAWATRNAHGALIAEALAANPDLTAVRLRTTGEVVQWLAQLENATADAAD